MPILQFLKNKKNIIIGIAIFFYIIILFLLPQKNIIVKSNYHVVLAESFLKGKIYIDKLPSHLADNQNNEFVKFNNKYYITFAPVPSILIAPIVAIWGPDIEQRKISYAVGILCLVVFWKILNKTKFNTSTRIWLFIFFLAGNNFLLSIIAGTSWYLAHSFAILFLLLAINELFGRKRPFVIGLFFIMASLSRLPVFLSFPFFFFMIINKKIKMNPHTLNDEVAPVSRFARLKKFINPRSYTRNSLGVALKKIFQFLLPVFILGLIYLIYNYARFQTILDQTYQLIYQKQVPGGTLGVFNIRYFWKNFFYTFINPPQLTDNYRHLIFNLTGTGLFFVSPFFVYIIFASFKRKINYLAAVSIALISIPSLLFYNTGYVQFGPRFTLDYLPFLMLLLFSGVKKGTSPLVITLIIASVIINLLGIVSFAQRLT